MRTLGLTTRDLDDSRSHWTVERRKVGGAEDDGVVIIGSSRILWDTNLDVWEEITGRRPIQLALPGTNPRQFLEEFANDPSFDGFLVVGVTPDIYFGDWPGIPQFSGLTKFWHDESPSQRFGHRVGMLLQPRLAFLDGAYALGTLVDRLPVKDREGVRGPVRDVWKIWDVGPDRQYALWSRIQTDERLREHARWVWVRSTARRSRTRRSPARSNSRSAMSRRSAPTAAKWPSCARRPPGSTTSTSFRPCRA